MANGDAPVTASPPQSIHAQLGLGSPIHEEKHLKVICIGAGASGLLVAYKLQRNFANYDLVCYEKNPDLGGTWYENRYPGCVVFMPLKSDCFDSIYFRRCACDVPAHTYTWSFEPNPSWSSVYASSVEIYEYFKSFSAKYNLDKYCKFNHEVSGAKWNAESAKWEVAIKNGVDGTIIHDSCDILINAGGLLNNWKWPDIEGLHDYKGKLLHTAHWDQSVDLNGKHVGLIGNG